MRIYKPLRVSVLTRVYELGTKPFLVVTGMLFFPLDRPDVLLGEQSLWTTLGPELGHGKDGPGVDVEAAQAVLDEALPKARAEVLVRGYAYPAGGPNVGCTARLIVGPNHPGENPPEEAPLIDKSLRIAGDRRWEFLGMTKPEPFERMPLQWNRAFGGPGFAANPAGRGIASTTIAEGSSSGGKVAIQLPNVEHPDRLVVSKSDRPAPASFGPIDPSWPPRVGRMGTHDQLWRERDYPGMPVDHDLHAFQTAQEDQWIEGFLEGGERVVVEHMHPTIARLETTVPLFKTRMLLHPKGEDGAAAPLEALRDLSTRIDTLILFPHLGRGVVVHRGIAEIQEDDAYDIENLMVAIEAPDAPRSLDHYRDRIAARLDKRRGAFVSLREADLEPKLPRYAEDDGVGAGDGLAGGSEFARLLKRDRLLEKNMARGAALKHAELVAEIRAAGLEPSDFDLPEQSPVAELANDPSDEEEDPVDAERRSAAEEAEERDAEQRRKEAEDQARALSEANGMDYDEMMRSGEGGGPPTYTADGELEKLREAVADAERNGVPLIGLARRMNDPRAYEEMQTQERRLKDAYRSGAHVMAPAKRPPEDAARALRERVLVAASSGEPALFHDVDLTGADLSGANLRGLDLSGAFLERADLSGADLTGAKLDGAVLTRANLRGATLSGASLSRANLGEADLDGAVLDGATLDATILFRARLDRARFAGARLANVDAWEAKGEGTDLTGASLEKVTFIQSSFGGLVASQARVAEVIFLDSTLDRADFSGATGDGLSFVKTTGADARFARARIEHFRMVGDSAFVGADFTGAAIPGACLRKTNLERATFLGADVSRSDLGEIRATGATFRCADLTEAVLMRSDLREADLSDANLLDAILQKAKLAGAKVERANAFQADFAGARGDERTSFEGANVGRIRMTRVRT